MKSIENQSGESSTGFFKKKVDKLIARHRFAKREAQSSEKDDRDSRPAIDLSRRNVLFAAGLGTGLAIGGSTERLLGRERELGERRVAFNEFLEKVDEFTNLDHYYPNGFSNLTDEDLEGVFVVRKLTDAISGTKKNVYQLSLPRESENALSNNLFPAIDVKESTYNIGQPSEYSRLTINAHFLPLNTENGKQVQLCNLDLSHLPHYDALTDDEMFLLVSNVIKDTGFGVETDRNAWEKDWFDVSDLRNTDVWKMDLAIDTNDGYVGVNVDDSGEILFMKSVHKRLTKGAA